MGWKFKAEARVQDINPSADFLASFTLLYKPGMRYDFRDFRPVTKTGKELPYFIETITNFSSAFIWVKLPKGTDLFWIYYGNGGAVSKSDGSKVFTFFDSFAGNALSSSVWNSSGSGITVSNSVLQLLNTSTSCYIESKATYPVNSLVEMRVNKQSGQRGPFGLRSISSAKAAGWQGAAGSVLNDTRYTNNGSSGDWDDDGVNRSGAYHVYGVAHINTAPRFYVDYSYRGNNTTTYPGSVSLPIHFYAYSNEGYVKIDWVRVRTYAATEPTVTIGRRYLNKPTEKEYPWDQAITGVNTRLGLSCSVTLKTFLSNIRTNLGLRASVMFRHPQYYIPALTGLFSKWKFEGSIDLGSQSSPARVQMPVYPGMRLNGRDLRFTDQAGKKIQYNIFGTTSDKKLDIWVDNAGKQRINFYYGNGVAKAESNPAIVGTPTTETVYTTVGNVAGGGNSPTLYSKWKGEGIITLSGASSAAGGEQILINLKQLPGMTPDGRDLRFTDPTGKTELKYWIETTTASNFNIWVKLPALVKKIRLFYGNSLATAKSSASDTFDFYDTFPGSSLDTSVKWTLVNGTATVSGSLLTLGSVTQNTMAVTQSTWGVGYIVEMQQYHASNNQMINGFNDSTPLRAAWLGASGANSNDYVTTHNGSTSTTTLDGVNRSGTTFYKYAVARDTSEVRFYVNDALRQTVTTTLPAGNISIGVYSEINSGNVVIDWVRLRKITALSGSLTSYERRSGGTLYYETTTSEEIEVIPVTKIKHWPQWPAIQVYYDYIKTPNTVLGLRMGEPEFKERRELKDYNTGAIDVSRSINDAYSQLSTEFYDLVVPPEGGTVKHFAPSSVIDKGNFSEWTDTYEIKINNPSSESGVQIEIKFPISSKMNGDGSDIRFTDTYYNSIPYYIESIGDRIVTTWVKLPATIDKIYLLFGNSAATSESSAESVFDVFDSFENLNGWETGADYTVDNGELVIDTNSTGWATSKTHLDAPYIMEFRGRITEKGTNINLGSCIHLGNNSSWAGTSRGYLTSDLDNQNTAGFALFKYNSGWTSLSNVAFESVQGTYYNIRIIAKQTGIEQYIYSDGWEELYKSASTTDTTFSEGYFGFVQISGQSRYDWVRVRKYVAIMPTATVIGDTRTILFSGKVLPSVTSMGRDIQRVRVSAVDNCINLVTQTVPWNYQVIDTALASIPTWIERLIDYPETGVYLNTAIDAIKDPHQFVFDPKTKRLDAIKQIAQYAGYVYTSKIMPRVIDGQIVTHPEFYFVLPERIDEGVNGFDLPAPITLINPATSLLNGNTLIDEPTIEKESEEKYNKVTVYGVRSDTKETVVASAFSYEVFTGDQKAREIPIQDNTIAEKGSTAEKEAIKWLLYYLAPRAKVKMSFANRFDLELYQRIKFSSGFPNKFTELTNSAQVPQVAVCDPRDYANSVHLIDVSQVPRPSWLRISSLKYKSEQTLETVDVEAVTDFIYSVIDPIIQAPYSDYLGPGYYKPVLNDSYSETQSIVEDNIEKQLTPTSGTVLSINTEEKTAVVQTANGNIVTISLA